MKKIFCFLSLLILSGILLFAQSTQELRPGGVPVLGTLYEGSEIWYSIRAAETGFLIVETTGDTDTFLEAYDDQRNFIIQNDDGGEGLNARVEIFVTAGRTYLFKLRGYSNYSTGPYRIWAAAEPVPASTELRFGLERPDFISEGQRNWYSVRTTEAGYVIVETFGNDIDTYMYAYDSQYNLFMQDDDGGQWLNARIEFLAEANQTYYFVVRGFGSWSSGRYDILAIHEPLPIDTERNTVRERAVTVRLGEAIPVFFHTINESRWYRYDATRDGTVFVVQTRGNMDTTLLMYDDRGNLIAEDYYSGDYPGNSLIHIRLNTGTYFIEVRTYSNGAGATGRCTLHAETR